MKKATAKSLAKTAVLDASDNPDEQDEARKRRVKMDFQSWRKQTKAGKTTHQEEVGISSAAAMAKARKEAELKAKEEAAVKKQKEATKKEEVQFDEVYKKLPVAKMASKISKKQFKAGQSGDVKTISKKSTETGKMIGVLDTHDPERSKAKSKIKEAKVDVGDDVEREEGRNKRKFGTKGNYGHTLVRRRMHRANRGDKKIRGNKEVNVATGKVGKEIGEAKVDTGKTADQKSTARNLRNTPPGADKTTDLKTFITRKPGESLDKARQRVRQGQHAARRGVKEETIDELNRYEKEKGKSTGSASYRSGVNTPRKGTPTKKGGSSDKIIHFAKGLVRGAEGRPTGQTRRSYDARGKETDRKEKPEFTVTKRRERRARADAAMRDTSGT